MAKKYSYVDLMAERKQALFCGDERKAALLLALAEKLVEKDLVSDDELLAGAYI
ncbi:hypothetical protein [Synechococcus elongatus]|uniref:hypothetical protein n=1 Tax=Synechococcus elongatus TaxID=32046 RepID=UPI0002DEF31A|nr:hypothetical protein [Synechococcus elongatus]MBD2588394.1 hypothetical protein [Synechococcus elongatus FACHB-242]MBD2689443.1 hypothetical protein [Synechococcus elongatus FACHB-1061]MBD2708138.1 hypothetical protein [Synechococcus elongatus PCC 7942 = FACHB-805]WKW04554.1 hypothetical protein QY054_08115 [Synechococcus elongatus PCC 7942 = FACHB-805]